MTNSVSQLPLLPLEKRCGGPCGQLKPLDDFHTHARGSYGRAWACKKCFREYQNARNKRLYDTNKVRRKHLKRAYGLTPEEYQAMFEAQDGLCAACRHPETMFDERIGRISPLHVDHDHSTGQIRQLLCSNCNRALGYLQEDADRIKGLLEYIERWKPVL